MNNPLNLCFLTLLFLPTVGPELDAQTGSYRIDRLSQWQTWHFPPQTLDLKEDGSITPLKVEGPVNTAVDAHQYFHRVNSNEWQGGVRKVGSNPATASNVIDGRYNTYWQPDPDDTLKAWQIDIDLGRVVPATMIRLHFPDQAGARPWREFRVFATNGELLSSQRDAFIYHLIGGTTEWNEETVVEFPVSSGDLFVRRVFRLGTALADTGHLYHVRPHSVRANTGRCQEPGCGPG